MNKEKLIDGCIPKHTECPYKEKCDFHCEHQGINHSVDFSCAYVRAFDIIYMVKNE